MLGGIFFGTQNKAQNNDYAKPMVWMFQRLFFGSQAFGLDVPSTPTPSSLRAKPLAWMFQPIPPSLHKERPQPQPKALPLSRGRDATAPTRRSFIKVLLPKVGRREISYATELRLFCVRSAHLKYETTLKEWRFAFTFPFITIQPFVLGGIFFGTPTDNINTEAQRYRVFIFLYSPFQCAFSD